MLMSLKREVMVRTRGKPKKARNHDSPLNDAEKNVIIHHLIAHSIPYILLYTKASHPSFVL